MADEDAFLRFRSRLIRALVLACGLVAWQHLAVLGIDGGAADRLPYAAADLMLALPVAWLAVRCAEPLLPPGGGSWEPITRACATAGVLLVCAVPLAVIQLGAHRVMGGTEGHHHLDGGPALSDPAALLAHGAGQALQCAPAVLLTALLAGLLAEARLPAPARWLPAARRPLRMSVLGVVLGALLVPTAVAAEDTAVRETGRDRPATRGCEAAPQREFDVYAIDVDIVLDRFGDHDPYGYMYVLAKNEQAVLDQQEALRVSSALELDDPDIVQVSPGLGQDPIQPLVIRARLGECVVINLTNKLENAPRNGFGNPVITQPGGVPAVSVDLAGVAYDAAGGAGGQAVGDNPQSVLAAPGETKTYRYFLDPLMGEGARAFRSGGDSTQLTAHGLFGTLIAEPAGARWFDPVTGEERTDDTGWSNWEAMIQPAQGPSFREFTIIYHEIGDENFTVRRPLRENDQGVPIGNDPGIPVGDQVEYGRNLPMIDSRPITPDVPSEGGGGTNVYRPASRAINYRAEPFFRRLQLEAPRGAEAQDANKSLAYSSYSYGDPATPMPRSYLGEPTKTRVVHAGAEQLHVHHVHGGGTRWRMNPGADDPAMDSGLSKTPIQDAASIRLDSQTISPMEAFSLEHECGAGGCQQAAGDFLYHCHISHHYVTGMWGLWRVFDTRQPDLAPLPGREAAPRGVTSDQLVGEVIEGREVVPDAEVTDPDTQIGLEQLVESHLPPQGARWGTEDGTPDPDDATVWDWVKEDRGGPAPVYRGEPETDAVWANYRSPDPGSRPDILFNPDTGRPAYPMLRPHLGMRPPFSPNGHAGSPGVGEIADENNPGAMCPADAEVRSFDITAVSVPIQTTERERDENGRIFVLNEDKDAVLAGDREVEPLVIRSNVADCVAVTLGSQLDEGAQRKVNMHTHLVQFDPLASDGVVAGFAYEQSVFNTDHEGRELTSVDAGDAAVTVSDPDRLRPGISVGIGVGTETIEIRRIEEIDGDRLVLDRPLEREHTPGEPVTVEFVQYRWFSDVDTGTVFFHDHVDAVTSWSHGLFAAHNVEPPGSQYRDPRTGEELRSGAIADIIAPPGSSVGVGQSGAFREYTIFLHNGRRGRAELDMPPGLGSLNPFNGGQECEEGSINLRAAPLGERTPPGDTPADPATTDQRQEYNGAQCRNAFTREGGPATTPDAYTARATVTTVDPYVFSSVKYGDPGTPLLRAYAGDPVVIRTIGVNERAEALRIQGHRFRVERFNEDARLVDAATTGISERYDYVLDGGAGGPSGSPGDYLYYSTRTFALESGAWGILRVHDTLQDDLLPLPDHAVTATGAGFPRQQPAEAADTQREPGPDPAPAYRKNGTVDRSVVTSTAAACPRGARALRYDVSVIDQELPTAPFTDSGGVIYALTSDVAAIRAGTKAVEPLVLRANAGDCVTITLRNRIDPDALYGGTRAGLDLAMLTRNQQLSSGAAVGLNPDTTVAAGASATYTFHADEETGGALFQNLGSTASLRHGAYGMLIVEPRGSRWTDSESGKSLGAHRVSTEAVIRRADGTAFREFALLMHSTDQQYARSILPYGDQVAGNGLNSPDAFNWPLMPIPGGPPGTEGNPGSFDKGFSHINYHSAPLTERLGLTAFRDDYTEADVIGSYGIAFSSTPYGDPDTPVFRARAGDEVVLRVGVGASDQLHSFTVGGHAFPLEPGMAGSSVISTRTLTAGQTLDAHLGPAGGGFGYHGDYLYGDGRQPFAQAGMWGILRVLPAGSRGGPARL
ncbi:hypothetical protein N0X72_17480 [Streptomyces carpaticus]|uniref:hypothetical protein n=1 Tax=Streptomyces carpaticus TaxID=285558 RepID=UPI0021FBD12D|nr:hypothetical protein N0X72_17480 [Streptomyces carpaticus]